MNQFLPKFSIPDDEEDAFSVQKTLNFAKEYVPRHEFPEGHVINFGDYQVVHSDFFQI